MYKVAILGCENSHADGFLKLIAEDETFKDIEVVGVFSEETEAAQKLGETFNVPVMKTLDECVGKIDGLIITARAGRDHYPFAKPYMASGIPMFIDKPVTASVEDALALVADLKANNIPVCGGSSAKDSPYLHELKAIIASGEKGACHGGYFRAPIRMVNPYGNFSFYAEHNIAMMTAVFGFYPKKVYAIQNGCHVDCIVSYEDFNVHLEFVDYKNYYYAMITMDKETIGDRPAGGRGTAEELEHFLGLLTGERESLNYQDFIAPVFIMNAIERSLESGEAVAIEYP